MAQPATRKLLRALTLIFFALLAAACSALPSTQTEAPGQQATAVPDTTDANAAAPESALVEQLRPRFLHAYASW